MAENDGSIQIPGWAGKAALGIIQSITVTALIATMAWAWNTEGRMAGLEYELAQANSTIAAQQATLSLVGSHEISIEVLKEQLKNIREDIAELKVLIQER